MGYTMELRIRAAQQMERGNRQKAEKTWRMKNKRAAMEASNLWKKGMLFCVWQKQTQLYN